MVLAEGAAGVDLVRAYVHARLLQLSIADAAARAGDDVDLEPLLVKVEEWAARVGTGTGGAHFLAEVAAAGWDVQRVQLALGPWRACWRPSDLRISEHKRRA